MDILWQLDEKVEIQQKQDLTQTLVDALEVDQIRNQPNLTLGPDDEEEEIDPFSEDEDEDEDEDEEREEECEEEE